MNGPSFQLVPDVPCLMVKYSSITGRAVVLIGDQMIRVVNTSHQATTGIREWLETYDT